MIGTSNSITQAFINDSIAQVNDDFDKSPSFKKIQLDGVQTDCIINHKKSNVLDILLRPQSVITKGLYVTFNTDTFLLTEFIANEIYPKATLELCNANIKWKDSANVVKEFKCIVKGESYKEVEDKLVVTSESEIAILVQYNDETKTIKPNQRFIFGNSAFEVTSIDEVSNVYKGKGILKLGVKYTSATDTDDKTNQIADKSGNSGWGGWT
jgi:hypothetical protein